MRFRVDAEDPDIAQIGFSPPKSTRSGNTITTTNKNQQKVANYVKVKADSTSLNDVKKMPID